MSSRTELGLVPPAEKHERNWLPLAIAAGTVVLVAAIAIFALQRGKGAPQVTPVSAPLDAYAASLPIANLAMSESASLSGGKVTYLDGHISNQGNRTISGIVVQVLFRNAAHEVTQNETQNLKLIRTREPYVDIEPLSAAPLKPGDEREFRLIFDGVSPDWDGAYPDVRIIRVEGK